MSNITKSREQADQLVTEFFQSLQTQRNFCKERNLNISTFQWWIKRYKESTASANKEQRPSFVRIGPQKTIAPSFCDKESELTVDFQSGTRLKWRGYEVPSSLCQLITILTTAGGTQ